jgi:hypothetical protein
VIADLVWVITDLVWVITDLVWVITDTSVRSTVSAVEVDEPADGQRERGDPDDPAGGVDRAGVHRLLQREVHTGA